MLPDQQLLTSELVTSAIRHAESMLVLRVELSARTLLVSVEDLSPEAPTVRRAVTGEDESGYGLALLEALSASWGWERTGTGKRVWFEL